jgi:hypothetical protein
MSRIILLTNNKRKKHSAANALNGSGKDIARKDLDPQLAYFGDISLFYRDAGFDCRRS